ARVRALLDSHASPPFNIKQNTCAFSISCIPSHYIGIMISGRVMFNATSQEVFRIDVNACIRKGDNVPHLDWRFSSKDLGQQLYHQLFASHPVVLSSYQNTLGGVSSGDLLHFRFLSSRDLLRVPLELLFDTIHDHREYLVLQHPLARSVS